MDLWRLMQREPEEDEADTIWMYTHVLGSQWIYTAAIHLENKQCFLKCGRGGFYSYWHNFMRIIVKSSLAEISKSKLNAFFKNEAFVHWGAPEHSAWVSRWEMPWFVSWERLNWIITDFASGLTFPLVNVRILPDPESQVLYLYILRPN